jgi:hypothetical protein
MCFNNREAPAEEESSKAGNLCESTISPERGAMRMLDEDGAGRVDVQKGFRRRERCAL